MCVYLMKNSKEIMYSYDMVVILECLKFWFLEDLKFWNSLEGHWFPRVHPQTSSGPWQSEWSQFHKAKFNHYHSDSMSSFGIKVSFSKIDGDFKKSSTWQNKVLAAPSYSFPFNYVGMVVGGGGSFTCLGIRKSGPHWN